MDKGAARIGFSVVIPTYNREKDLRECIDSILTQTLLPDEVLIVDDGNLPEEFVNSMSSECRKKGIALVYYKKNHALEPRGSSESRNIGCKLAKNEIFFLLDDDVILDEDFFEKIMQVWQDDKNPNLIAVGGIIKNNRKKSRLERLYTKVFGLGSRYSWDVNDIAFQVWDDGLKQREKGYYTHGGGGGCSYSRSLVQKVGGFSTFSGGRTALEDVDFSLRAKNLGYYSIVEPAARVIHKRSQQSREKEFLIGLKESQNRKSMFRDNCRKSWLTYLRFYWANLGWILGQIALRNFSRAFGMVRGLLSKAENDAGGENAC
jgi:GT2 family glycosyltransferase